MLICVQQPEGANPHALAVGYRGLPLGLVSLSSGNAAHSKKQALPALFLGSPAHARSFEPACK